MSCRLPSLILAAVLMASVPAMAQEVDGTNVTTSELKSDSLALPDLIQTDTDFPPEKSVTILASSLLGQTLYARDGNRIGLISDLVMTQELDGLLAIVGVGGFLGFGTRDVAIPKDRIAVTEDKSGELRFTVASTREQLQQAPVFDRTALVR